MLRQKSNLPPKAQSSKATSVAHEATDSSVPSLNCGLHSAVVWPVGSTSRSAVLVKRTTAMVSLIELELGLTLASPADTRTRQPTMPRSSTPAAVLLCSHSSHTPASEMAKAYAFDGDASSRRA